MFRLPSASALIARDERGSVTTIAALSFVTVLLVTGAAIDYSRSATQWSNLQQATDATTLAVAHTYLNAQTTQSTVQTFAQSYLSGLINGATVTVATLPSNHQSVCMTSKMSVPTTLMKLGNINSVNVSATACSQVPTTSTASFEVALALDNSGSMSDAGSDGATKISSLITAAKQLVATLIPSGTTSPTANIALVPFTGMVNANINLASSSAMPAFMDSTAVSSIHWQNFQIPSGATFKPKTKFDLFSALKGSYTWGGCVEERPYPYTTTDTAASTSTGDTMFVPYFAPDEPGFTDNTSYGFECYPNQTSSTCTNNRYYNSYLSDYSSDYTATGNCSQANKTADQSSSNIFPNSTMSMVCKYYNATVTVATSAQGPKTGPNYLCTSQLLTPLSDDTSVLNSAIGSMVANGSTNLAAGFMWAWRTISPTVNPFPTSNPASTIGYHTPQSYASSSSTSTNKKIIILLTDGQNDFAINTADSYFKSLYGGFGYYANNRLSNYMTSSSNWSYGACSSYSATADIARCQLDNVTLEACTNAKNQNITVYTIGVSVAGGDQIDARGVSLLQTCATTTSNYYQVSDLSSLNTAFQQIASGINNLRLSQ